MYRHTSRPVSFFFSTLNRDQLHLRQIIQVEFCFVSIRFRPWLHKPSKVLKCCSTNRNHKQCFHCLRWSAHSLHWFFLLPSIPEHAWPNQPEAPRPSLTQPSQVQRVSPTASQKALNSRSEARTVNCQCFGSLQHLLGKECNLQPFGNRSSKEYNLDRQYVSGTLALALHQVCMCCSFDLNALVTAALLNMYFDIITTNSIPADL